MVEGMPEFVKGEIYGGMVKGFAANFGKAIDTDGEIPTATITKTAKKDWQESFSSLLPVLHPIFRQQAS